MDNLSQINCSFSIVCFITKVVWWSNVSGYRFMRTHCPFIFLTWSNFTKFRHLYRIWLLLIHDGNLLYFSMEIQFPSPRRFTPSIRSLTFSSVHIILEFNVLEGNGWNSTWKKIYHNFIKITNFNSWRGTPILADAPNL